jgi:hypothetical protein
MYRSTFGSLDVKELGVRVTYDEVIEVDGLKKPRNGAGISRLNGYAVELEGQWFWFPSVEPAYAFGRAGRMSAQVGSWDIREAATEARWDEKLARDVFRLYIVTARSVPRDPATDRRLLAAFASGVDPRSSHWRTYR